MGMGLALHGMWLALYGDGGLLLHGDRGWHCMGMGVGTVWEWGMALHGDGVGTAWGWHCMGMGLALHGDGAVSPLTPHTQGLPWVMAAAQHLLTPLPVPLSSEQRSFQGIHKEIC